MKPLLTEEECTQLRRQKHSEAHNTAELFNAALQSAAALGARKQRERNARVARDRGCGCGRHYDHSSRCPLSVAAAIEADGECDTCGSSDRATHYAIHRPGTYEGPCENDWHNEETTNVP